MDENLLQVGVGGLMALLILREVFGYLIKKKGDKASEGSKLAKQVDELWHWHAKEDSDGVKIWYVRKSLEDAVSRLASAIEIQTSTLKEIHRVTVETNKMSLEALKRIAELEHEFERERDGRRENVSN